MKIGVKRNFGRKAKTPRNHATYRGARRNHCRDNSKVLGFRELWQAYREPVTVKGGPFIGVILPNKRFRSNPLL